MRSKRCAVQNQEITLRRIIRLLARLEDVLTDESASDEFCFIIRLSTEFILQTNYSSETDSPSRRIIRLQYKFGQCREHNMTRKLSDSHYVHNQERTSLLPLKCLQNHIFTFLRNFQCQWMLWSIDYRTIIHAQGVRAGGRGAVATIMFRNIFGKNAHDSGNSS